MRKVTVRQEGVEYKPEWEIESVGFALKSIGGILQCVDFGELAIQTDFELPPLATLLGDYASRLYHANHERGCDCQSEVDRVAHELYALSEILYWTDLRLIVDRPEDVRGNRVYIENFSIRPIGEKLVDYGQRMLALTIGDDKYGKKGLTPELTKATLTNKPKKGKAPTRSEAI